MKQVRKQSMQIAAAVAIAIAPMSQAAWFGGPKTVEAAQEDVAEVAHDLSLARAAERAAFEMALNDPADRRANNRLESSRAKVDKLMKKLVAAEATRDELAGVAGVRAPATPKIAVPKPIAPVRIQQKAVKVETPVVRKAAPAPKVVVAPVTTPQVNVRSQERAQADKARAKADKAREEAAREKAEAAEKAARATAKANAADEKAKAKKMKNSTRRLAKIDAEIEKAAAAESKAIAEADEADAAVLDAENNVRALENELVKIQDEALMHSKAATRARTGEERANEIAAMFAAEKREKSLTKEIASAKRKRASLVEDANDERANANERSEKKASLLAEKAELSN